MSLPLVSVTACIVLAGCLGQVGGPDPDEHTLSPFSNAGEEALCFVKVHGKGVVDVERRYLANVLFCENTHGTFEGLKAQAIASRTFLYWKVRKWGYIGDGQGSQAYSCNNRGHTEAEKLALLEQAQHAVDETERQVMLHDGQLTCGFFAAGILKDSSCEAKYLSAITNNLGRTGSAVLPSGLGDYRSKDCVNRGGMSQNGANCMVKTLGYAHLDILRYYYGADIQVATRGQACPVKPSPPQVTDKPPGFDDLICPYGNYGKNGDLCWNDVPDRTYRCAWDPTWKMYLAQRCDVANQRWLTVSMRPPSDCQGCCGPKTAACDP